MKISIERTNKRKAFRKGTDEKTIQASCRGLLHKGNTASAHFHSFPAKILFLDDKKKIKLFLNINSLRDVTVVC